MEERVKNGQKSSLQNGCLEEKTFFSRQFSSSPSILGLARNNFLFFVDGRRKLRNQAKLLPSSNWVSGVCQLRRAAKCRNKLLTRVDTKQKIQFQDLNIFGLGTPESSLLMFFKMAK